MYVNLNLELMLKRARFSYAWGMEASPVSFKTYQKKCLHLHWDVIPENDGSI